MDEMMDAFFIGYVVVSVGVTIAMAYMLQTVADKNGLSEIARFLAWIPILGCYPMLLVCGASVGQFLLVIIGLIAAGVAAGVAGSMLGGSIGAGAAAFIGIGAALNAAYYFGKLFWVMAERRELSGWVGLLMFIPLVNLGVFAYIAFHDGFSPINKAGCAVGLMLAIGSSMGNYQLQSLLEQSGSAFEMAMQEAGEADPEMLAAMEQAALEASAPQHDSMPGSAMDGDGLPAMQDPADEMERTKAAIRAMMVMGDRFDAMKGLDTRDPAQAAEMQSKLDAARMELASARLALGEEATEEFLRQIERLQARIGQDGSESGSSMPASMGHAGRGRGESGRCPADTRRMGNSPPQGNAAWCEGQGGVKDGWYASWHDNGELESQGDYQDGARIGTWMRYFPDGARRVRAEFEAGVQHGDMVVWDASGRVVRETYFQYGEPVSR
jgi:hypothetical protein